jgi:hypothetical protein
MSNQRQNRAVGSQRPMRTEAHVLADRVDRKLVQIMYVETCPDCECPIVRSESGERRASTRLAMQCSGCTCHPAFLVAAGS